MKKAEFVDKLPEKGNITKKLASESTELAFKTVAETLVTGGEISIPGFGKFYIAVRESRTGLNPQTKAKINILETKIRKFRSANELKESMSAKWAYSSGIT